MRVADAARNDVPTGKSPTGSWERRAVFSSSSLWCCGNDSPLRDPASFLSFQCPVIVFLCYYCTKLEHSLVSRLSRTGHVALENFLEAANITSTVICNRTLHNLHYWECLTCFVFIFGRAKYFEMKQRHCPVILFKFLFRWKINRQ